MDKASLHRLVQGLQKSSMVSLKTPQTVVFIQKCVRPFAEYAFGASTRPRNPVYESSPLYRISRTGSAGVLSLIVGEPLLLPLVIAIALWHLINTLAQSLHRIELAGYRLPVLFCRTAAVFIFLSLIWVLINFLSASADEVLEVAPVYQENLTNRLQNVPFIDFTAFKERPLSDLVAEWIDIPYYADIGCFFSSRNSC